MSEFVIDLIAELQRIERETNGRALTPDEAKKLEAAKALRLMAPYLFDGKPSHAQKA